MSQEKAYDPSSATLGPVLDFMRLVWAVDHGLAARSKRMESQLGVTGPQRFVLRVVGRYPGISAGELAEILHLHPSTLTGILQRLESAGLLKRKDDPVDRRRALFVLSPKGRRVDVPKSGTVEEAVRRTLGTLREGEISGARHVLVALAQQLTDGDARRKRASALGREPRAQPRHRR
jgi:DNA-binding MarR family transcriptional regulator